MIRRICRRLLSEDAGRISRARLLEALTAEDAADFGGLAGRVRTVYRWEDLIIDPAGEQVLKAACDRFRLRNRVGDAWGLKLRNAYGNGVSILLYGPPGTGKTMAAQVVAGEVGLPLYRVDISQIFSKYIGETEKHLSAIFREAQRVNAALFFDEADALFSRRTEVSGSNDKYANAETAHLLQKIEEYSGLTILATNYYGNFDQAFIRRITYAVRLDQPDAAARLKLWQNTLPAEAPLDPSVDFSFFAEQFDCTGSQIKAILYSAAYLAGAEEAGQIGIRHIVRAMRLDFEKQGRLIETAAFGPYARYL
ncbi:MAG: ATP-binding protein [Lachnospiraceae bacterium]|nr:ATP-binding protein [Lachnospiraceae bacterium]